MPCRHMPVDMACAPCTIKHLSVHLQAWYFRCSERCQTRSLSQYPASAAAVNRSQSRWALRLAFVYMVHAWLLSPFLQLSKGCRPARIPAHIATASQQGISMRQLSVLQCCLGVTLNPNP